jgi:hypothetical protein
MPERSDEHIRMEIASERQRLADDLTALRKEARLLVPIALGGLVAVGVFSRGKGVRTGLKLLWRLR